MLNFTEIKIALLVITHTVVPVNLHYPLKSSGLHLWTQWNQRLPSVTFHIEREVMPLPLSGKIICAPVLNLKSLAQVVLEILMPQWLTWPWTTS